MADSGRAAVVASRRPRFRALVVGCALALSASLVLPIVGSPPIATALTTTVTISVHDSHHVVVSGTKVGGAVHAAVRLSGLLPPTGTVTISRFNGGTCFGRSVSSKPTTLVNGRADVTDFTFLPTAVGTFSFGAAYQPSPGSPYVAAKACKAFTVSKAGPTVTIVFQLGDDGAVTSVEAGQMVRIVTTVRGPKGVPVPTGALTMRRFTDAGCTAQESESTSPLHDGSVTIYMQRAAPTTRWFRASYAGDARYTQASSVCTRLIWTKATPAVNGAIHDPGHVTVDSVVDGTAVHAFVRVRGFILDNEEPTEIIPTGQVRGNWYDDGACTIFRGSFGPVPLVTGQVEFVESTQLLPPGTYGLRIQYLGNGVYKSWTGPCLKLTVAAIPTAAPATPTPHATTAPLGPTPSPTGAVAPTASLMPTEIPASSAAPSGGTGQPTAILPIATPSPAASPSSPATGDTSQPIDPLVLIVALVLVIGAIAIGFVFGRRRGGRPGPAP